MLAVVTSVNGVKIRLTEERWEHIIAQHPELSVMQAAVLDAVANPEEVLEGRSGQLISVKTMIADAKWLLTVYRELDGAGSVVDGFIVTAFFNSRQSYLKRRKILWP